MYEVLTSSQAGLVSQEDYFKKTVASKDTTGYKIIKNGQYTYRAMSDTGRFYINRLDNKDVGIVSPAYPVFEYVDNEDVLNNYLLEYFSSEKFQSDVSLLHTGSTRASLKFKQIQELYINVPSICEQKLRIRCIKLINHLILILSDIEQKYDATVKSRFVEMFGNLVFNPMNWPLVALVDTCVDKDDIKCGPFGTQLGKDEYVREGVPLWGIPQINAAFTIPPTDFLTEDKAEQLSAYSLLPGDIAMSRKGNVGKCAIYPENAPNGIIHSDVLRIRVDNKRCNPLFMMCQLHFSRAIEPQIAAVSNGAVMAGINVTKLKSIVVHVPPIEFQKAPFDRPMPFVRLYSPEDQKRIISIVNDINENATKLVG